LGFPPPPQTCGSCSPAPILYSSHPVHTKPRHSPISTSLLDWFLPTWNSFLQSMKTPGTLHKLHSNLPSPQTTATPQEIRPFGLNQCVHLPWYSLSAMDLTLWQSYAPNSVSMHLCCLPTRTDVSPHRREETSDQLHHPRTALAHKDLQPKVATQWLVDTDLVESWGHHSLCLLWVMGDNTSGLTPCCASHSKHFIKVYWRLGLKD
jgi:hypothetical protein